MVVEITTRSQSPPRSRGSPAQPHRGSQRAGDLRRDGDLSRKKLMPAVYDLANRVLLPPGFALVGFARRDWEDQDFAKVVHESVQQYARTEFPRGEAGAARGHPFRPGRVRRSGGVPTSARDRRQARRRARNDGQSRVLPLHPAEGVPPGHDAAQGVRARREGDQKPAGWRRVVIEKPFGHDLASARELNEVVESAFPADSIFRIDHYLGKETVQNILALRFANELYEPIWNRNYVDHVQITMAEDIGVGGRRVLRRERACDSRTVGCASNIQPAAAPRPHGDGGADQLQRRGPARREGEGARGRPPAGEPRRGDRPRTVRRRVAGPARRCSASSRKTA